MRYLITTIIFFSSYISFGQFNDISFSVSNSPGLEILQIDIMEESTLVHLKFTNTESYSSICCKQETYIQNPISYKKFHLLNSINLPLCDKQHLFDETNQVHNFTLEFEKTDTNLNNFSLISDEGLKVEGIKVDYSKKSEKIDVASFIDMTPAKESGYYLKDGNTILYQTYKGVTVSVMLTHDNNYGKYWQIAMAVKNLSGKSFNFLPSEITAKVYKTSKNPEQEFSILEGEVLTYNEYIKIVNRRQNWNAAMVAMSESMAASNAGYSSSSSRSSTQSYSNTNSSAYGSVSDNYGNRISGSMYGNSSSYGTSYTTKYAQSYNGAEQYWANQNANKNIANYQSRQYSVKNTLSEGYLKANTINNEVEYLGYINIKSSGKYKNAKHLGIVIPINGNNFVFSW